MLAKVWLSKLIETFECRDLRGALYQHSSVRFRSVWSAGRDVANIGTHMGWPKTSFRSLDAPTLLSGNVCNMRRQRSTIWQRHRQADDDQSLELQGDLLELNRD